MSARPKDSSNRFFYLVMFLLVSGVLLAWFFLHPNSPWVDRHEYVVLYDELGTLQPGDGVVVNGLKKGRVKDLQFVQDGPIRATLEVLAVVDIPENSQFRVANIGLMGKRIIDIRLGQSKTMLSPGDTVRGSTDYGMTRMGHQVRSFLGELADAKNTLEKTLNETILDSANQKAVGRTIRGVKQLDTKLGTMVRQSLASLDTLEQGLSVMAGAIEEVQNQNEPNLEKIQANFRQMGEDLEQLKANAEVLQNQLLQVQDNFQNGQNTASLLVHSKDFHQKLQEAVDHGYVLYRKLGASGLDLNVDIFD